MPELSGMLILVVVLALVFDFSNGWHDSANAIATVVSTRVISPFVAVIGAGILNVAGAFMSTAVAKMVGSGIVDPAGVTQHMVALPSPGPSAGTYLRCYWDCRPAPLTRSSVDWWGQPSRMAAGIP